MDGIQNYPPLHSGPEFALETSLRPAPEGGYHQQPAYGNAESRPLTVPVTLGPDYKTSQGYFQHPPEPGHLVYEQRVGPVLHSSVSIPPGQAQMSQVSQGPGQPPVNVIFVADNQPVHKPTYVVDSTGYQGYGQAPQNVVYASSTTANVQETGSYGQPQHISYTSQQPPQGSFSYSQPQQQQTAVYHQQRPYNTQSSVGPIPGHQTYSFQAVPAQNVVFLQQANHSYEQQPGGSRIVFEQKHGYFEPVPRTEPPVQAVYGSAVPHPQQQVVYATGEQRPYEVRPSGNVIYGSNSSVPATVVQTMAPIPSVNSSSQMGQGNAVYVSQLQQRTYSSAHLSTNAQESISPPYSHKSAHQATNSGSSPSKYSESLGHILNSDNNSGSRSPTSASELHQRRDAARENEVNEAKVLDPRRYMCPYCQKRFARPSSLQTHIYTHTGEKPFVCNLEGCGRAFSVLSNLRRHIRVCQKKRRRTGVISSGHGASFTLGTAPGINRDINSLPSAGTSASDLIREKPLLKPISMIIHPGTPFSGTTTLISGRQSPPPFPQTSHASYINPTDHNRIISADTSTFMERRDSTTSHHSQRGTGIQVQA